MNNQEDTSNNKLAEEMMEHHPSFSDAHHLLEMYQPHYEKFLLKKQFSLDEIKKFLSLLTDDDAMFATLYKDTGTPFINGFDTASNSLSSIVTL